MVYNVRSPQQWDIISREVDFEGKIVLDLGCGKGDIMLRAHDAGAKVSGIDIDQNNVKHIIDILPDAPVGTIDIGVITAWSWIDVDIIICFSVLPYLKYPERALEWINLHSDVALIECQYADDGQGFSFLTGNDDMRGWLLTAGKFEKVEPIGHTFVTGRNKNRFIWMCK